MTLLTTSDPTGAALTPEQRAQLVVLPLRRDSLALTTATVLDINRDSVKVPLLTTDINNVDVVAEGALLPEGEPIVREAVLRPVKIGITDTLSNESVTDSVPAALELWGESMAAQLRRRLDALFLRSDGTGLAPVGVLETPGIVVGTPLGGNLDAISDGIATIEEADGRADVIAMSPATWARLSRLKVGGSDSNAPLLGSPSAPSTGQSIDPVSGRSLFGVRVRTDPLLPDSVIAMWDSRVVAVALRSDTRVDVDGSFAFKNDCTVVRATLRAAWQVLAPERVVAVAVA